MNLTFRPIGTWPRALSRSRRRSTFKSDYNSTMRLLRCELHAINAQAPIIQLALSDCDIRRDGLPRADANPQHPGVIVSFERLNVATRPTSRIPYAFPCDAFTEWMDNLRAIALALEALRKVNRYGVTTHNEQYKGWQALPPVNPTMTREDAGMFVASLLRISYAEFCLNPRLYLNAAIRALHPDCNGGKEAAEWGKLMEAKDVLKAD